MFDFMKCIKNIYFVNNKNVKNIYGGKFYESYR